MVRKDRERHDPAAQPHVPAGDDYSRSDDSDYAPSPSLSSPLRTDDHDHGSSLAASSADESTVPAGLLGESEDNSTAPVNEAERVRRKHKRESSVGLSHEAPGATCKPSPFSHFSLEPRAQTRKKSEKSNFFKRASSLSDVFRGKKVQKTSSHSTQEHATTSGAAAETSSQYFCHFSFVEVENVDLPIAPT